MARVLVVEHGRVVACNMQDLPCMYSLGGAHSSNKPFRVGRKVQAPFGTGSK